MKKVLKKIIPNIIVDYIRIKRKSKNLNNTSATKIFTDIKNNQYWNSEESVSGAGSELSATNHLRVDLERIFIDWDIKSILDIPCGDFNWMQHVNLGKTNYIGGDIVTSLSENNENLYKTRNISFRTLDLTTDDLPKVDLIFCRDCLVHLTYKEICKALVNIKRSGSKYVMFTSFINTPKNRDILTGEWRKINLEVPPFLFKKPLDTIDEKYFEKSMKYRDKSMCLWSVSEIKIPILLKFYSWLV
jgi:hypothetical protein